MKKSLLSILIALVLIVALLPIVASADPATAGVNINDTVQTVTQGEAALYFTTDTAGAITAGGDEDTYKIKFVYPEGEGAVPTIYLRGAYIATAIKSDATSAATTKIVVEDTTAGKVTTADGDIEADTYMTAGITWSAGHGDLVIEGPGKLSMNVQGNAIIANGALTFNNLKLDLVTTGNDYRYAFGGTPTSITFNGGDYSVSVQGLALNHTANIVVNNADVYMTSAGQTLYSAADGLVTLNGGSFKVESTSTSGPATRKCNFVVNAGVLELISGKAASNGNYTANFSNYNGNPVGSAVWTDGRAFSYRGGNLSWYKYVKIEPGYAVNVTDGFAFLYDNADNKQSAALEGQTVGLSCEGSSETYEFLGWVVNEGSTEVTINNADQPKASFVMPAGNVSVTAKYKKLVKDSAILIDDVPYSVDQGADPLYFTTGDDGIVTAGGDATNYNVKFEYPAGADAAVLSLKGAKISSTIKSAEGADNTRIVVETDSSLVNTTITWSHSDLTVEGPGKLTIACNKTAFSINGHSIFFKNADVNANIEGEWRYVISGTPINIVFDGGKAYMNAPSGAIFITDTTMELTGGLEIKNDAEVIIEGGSPLYIENTHFGVTVQSGTLVLRNTTGSGNAFRLKSKKFVINGGTVELDGPMAAYPYNIVPDLSGYQGNYTAVTGEKDGLIPYDPEDGFAQGVDGTYRGYWKIEPAAAGHQCSLKMVKGKAATCTTAGEKFYYGCEECGAAYEDILGEKLIEDLATWKVIPAFGHTDDDKDGKCDTCETTISSGNSGTGNGSVQTSDSSFTALWIVALTLSAMGICVTFIYNKKMKAA